MVLSSTDRERIERLERKNEKVIIIVTMHARVGKGALWLSR